MRHTGKGIRDALASTATRTLTSYLDLGASVLILAYGGWTAMKDDGHLTQDTRPTIQFRDFEKPKITKSRRFLGVLRGGKKNANFEILFCEIRA